MCGPAASTRSWAGTCDSTPSSSSTSALGFTRCDRGLSRPRSGYQQSLPTRVQTQFEAVADEVPVQLGRCRDVEANRDRGGAAIVHQRVRFRSAFQAGDGDACPGANGSGAPTRQRADGEGGELLIVDSRGGKDRDRSGGTG